MSNIMWNDSTVFLFVGFFKGKEYEGINDAGNIMEEFEKILCGKSIKQSPQPTETTNKEWEIMDYVSKSGMTLGAKHFTPDTDKSKLMNLANQKFSGI